MEKAESLEIYNANQITNKFLKAITSEICIHILTTCNDWIVKKRIINELIYLLWEIDPVSVVKEGRFQGSNSLMLYCVLASNARGYTLNNLNELYNNIIKYPNVDINAVCIGEGPDKGITPLWLATRYKQWNLVNKLIEIGANIHCVCVGEGAFSKNKSLLWLVVNSYQGELANKLIDMGADINATCTSEGEDKGKSVLWLATHHVNWKLADKLIDMGADINATCTGHGLNTGQSVLWLAVYQAKWKLVNKLIEMGADINATCTNDTDKGKSVLWLAAKEANWILVNKLINEGVDVNSTCRKGSDKGKTVLWLCLEQNQWELVDKLMGLGANINFSSTNKKNKKAKLLLVVAKNYQVKKQDDLQIINRDIFYPMVTIMDLRSIHFKFPPNITLSKKDKTIINKLKNNINLYIKIFIPSTLKFESNNYYKKNNLNDLPKEIRQLIAIEYIKKDLANYRLSTNCIKYFSNEIYNDLFQNRLSKIRLQAQNDLEKGPYLYELVLFSNILSILRDNTNMLGLSTRNDMNKNKKRINEAMFRNSFLPAFEEAKSNNKEIATMNFSQRLKLYKIAKQYGNSELLQKPKHKSLTKDDFSAVLDQVNQNIYW